MHRRLFYALMAVLVTAGLLTPTLAGAHDVKNRDKVAETWTESSVQEAEEAGSSDNMSHVGNIAYERRYGESLPQGSDIEFARLRVGTPGEVTRAAGQSRIDTAAAVSQASFDQADTVVLARSDDYADALAGAPLATQNSASLLLSSPDTLSQATADEIQRLGASEAVLLGGPNALSPQVEQAVADLGLDTSRVAGQNRFATAAEIFDRLPDSDQVLIAEGEHAKATRGWPDALSASGYAAATGKPILLVNATRLPQETIDKLSSDVAATIVGGPNAVSQQVADGIADHAASVDRIAGANRYQTSVRVAQEAIADGATAATTWVATGSVFTDGLVAGPAVGAANGILVLVEGRDLSRSQSAVDFLERKAPGIDQLFLAGGPGAINDASEARLREIVTSSENSTSGGDNPGSSSATAPDAATDPAPLEADVREFAIASSYSNGMHIIDVTDPENPEIASVYDCGISQGDAQIYSSDGRTYATYTSEDTTSLVVESRCVQDAVERGDITFEDSDGNGEINGDEKAPAYGTYVVDITDPYNPKSAGLIKVPEGSHNGTVHPSGDYFYNSDSALIQDTTPQIQIYDIRDPSNIERVGTLDLPVHPGLGTSSHDITFSEDGTRGYSAALSTTVILDTTNPAEPNIISEFRDESIETEHGIKPFTLTDADGNEREFIAVVDEVIGALPGNVCPGGGVHFYEITGDKENNPLQNKVGVFFIPEQRLAGPNPLTGDIVEDEFGESGTCTAHVMRVHEDAPNGPRMTIAWYNAGVHVLDLSGLADDAAGNPAGMPVQRIGHFRFENSDTWSFKTNRFESDGSFYGYGNDIIRGFDVYRFEASAEGDSASDGSAGMFLTPREALNQSQAQTWPGATE